MLLQLIAERHSWILREEFNPSCCLLFGVGHAL